MTFSCAVTPKEIPTNPYAVKISYVYDGQDIKVHLVNPLKIPIQYTVYAQDKAVEQMLQSFNPIKLKALQDTSIIFPIGSFTEKPMLSFKGLFGDPLKTVQKNPFEFPFQKGKSYQIIQGNNSRFSHQSVKSRFAFDFAMKIGDTVCAGDKGVVIGIIGHNQKSGKSERYIDYANYITLYHPHSGLISQYVHLAYRGVLVAIGDEVSVGQPIGIVGMTGFTTTSHLHFNVLKTGAREWESTEIDFKETNVGKELKKGQWIRSLNY